MIFKFGGKKNILVLWLHAYSHTYISSKWYVLVYGNVCSVVTAPL